MIATLFSIFIHGATPSAAISDTLLPALIGGVVGSIVGFLGGIVTTLISNHHQLKRDREAHARTLKDAKRERLRSSYKVIRNATDKYQFEMQQFNHMPSSANISLTGMDEAVTEITLEDVGTDVTKIFFELRGAFHAHIATRMDTQNSSWEDVSKHKKTVFEKAEELTTAMQMHLKELES